jgi:hypothetical protein
MFRRVWWLLFPVLALVALHAGGCGSDNTANPDDGGAEGSDLDGTFDDGGNGDGQNGEGAAPCSGAGFACATNANCCSGVCDGKSNTCVTALTGGKCGAAGAKCAGPTDCCTLTCIGGACGATQCISDNMACSTDAECCGGSCVAGGADGGKLCKPINGSCRSSGNTCTGSSQCCSGLCQGGFCALASSFCIQTGDICESASDCCGGACNKAAGAVIGTCGLPPVGSSNCNGKVDGTICAGCNDCCSRVCAPYVTGVNICQPANGCHIDGDLCRKDTDCCGGDADAGLPGSGNVTCEIPTGYTIGLCRNPLSCNPEGNVCHYKGGPGSQYACTSSSARDDCCDFLGSKSDCELDALGVPRCHVVGLADGGVPCRSNGQTCAFTGDCCNGSPCVPGPNGELVCFSTTCVPVTGPCTVNADCCTGNECIVPLGSTQGTCNPLVPPPGVDASVTNDAGKTCSLYGQSCQTDADCCNGVSCTQGGGISFCNGATGCTCVNLIPR